MNNVDAEREIPSDIQCKVEDIINAACEPYGARLGAIGESLQQLFAEAMLEERLRPVPQSSRKRGGLKGELESYDSRVYLTTEQVTARFKISDVTLYRWGKDKELGFPQPLKAKRRKLFRETDIIEWETSFGGGGSELEDLIRSSTGPDGEIYGHRD